MSRTVPATVASAIAAETTQPVYLLEMGYSATVRAATWDADIVWSGSTWESSGIRVRSISARSATIEMPNGDIDPWLSLILNEGTRDITLRIYQHHTLATASPQSDAVLVFSGLMDETDISDDGITVRCVESSQRKTFPPTAVDESVFSYLMTSGDRIIWGNDVVTVN